MKHNARRRQRPGTTEPETPADATEDFACTECETNDTSQSNNGEVVCNECGLVIEEENIDQGPDWRAFGPAERDEKSRVGSPLTETMHDKGLTTNIDWKNKDAYGNSLSGRKRRQMNRLRTQQERASTKDPQERNLRHAFGEIDRMASALGVPQSVREISCMIYRRALEADLIRGRSIEGVASSSLYAGCRQGNIPRSLDDIETVSRVEQLEISRAYRYIMRELGLEMKPVSPKEHVPRFCSSLDVSNDVERKATEVIEVTAEAGLASGKSPTGFAAAAIYTAAMLCGEDTTQRAISEVSKTSEVTIRNRYQEQMEIFTDPNHEN
jgi:transcription initiation factor TFIIB